MFPGTTQTSLGAGEDIFVDSMDPAQISSDFAFEDSSASEFRNRTHVNAIWTDELRSISERRKRFMNRMGLNEIEAGLHLILDNPEIREDSCQRSPDPSDSERIAKNSGTELDPLSTSNDGYEWNLDRTIRDLDSGKKFLVHELGQDGLPSFLKEVGSDRLITFQEFENYLGISFSVQLFMHGENNIVGNVGGKEDSGIAKIEPKSSSWWKLFTIKSARKSTKVPRTMRMRVQYNWKRCVEFTAVYQGQEIQGHEGSINAMKFSPDGRYLATGGEDRIVRVWSVDEVNASCNSLVPGSSSFWTDKPKGCKIEVERKYSLSAPVVIPKRIFKLANKPIQELYGHTNDILDISWSKYNCLLTTASKDKTARIWQVGCDECLQVFQHNNYVTCIQFDPTDDGYFITGSIDGKIRIWGVRERRVIEWTDVRDIVTAISYQPNGQGFVVGTIAGSCHFYTSSGNSPQLAKQLFIQGKKKSAGKMITGFQFAPDDPEKVMITSADSKVRIVNGADVIQKYRGPRKSKRQLFASFTEDGRHIISVGDDSSIYIWNCKKPIPSSSKNSKPIRSCEHFFSKDVSIALPWPGIDHKLRGISSTHKSEYYKKRESSILRDLDRFLVRGWFFGESLSRGSISTWPEEKLTLWPAYTGDSEEPSSLASPFTTWSRVIVAADISGSIRVFHNYGLPVRL